MEKQPPKQKTVHYNLANRSLPTLSHNCFNNVLKIKKPACSLHILFFFLNVFQCVFFLKGTCELPFFLLNYVFIFHFGCAGSLLLHVGSLWLWCVAFSWQWLLCGREQALGTWALEAAARRGVVTACGPQGVQASGAVACELSCSAAHGISPEQGLNLCPPHWQADSHPLYHSAYSFERLLPQKHSITA